jgi:hypothetical protein
MQQHTAARQFVVHSVQVVGGPAARDGAARGATVLRLQASDGAQRRFLVDVHGLGSALAAPDRLVALERRDDASGGGWALRTRDGLHELPGDARVFVHEDLSGRVRALVPPQAVPWRQRLLWGAAFALLRTRAGRAWLAGRYRD